MNIPTLATRALRFLSNNSPVILTGVAVAGTVTTSVLAVKATPKALRILETERTIREKQANINNTPEVLLTKTEVVKLTWKCYVPAAISGVATISCIVGANSVNSKRNAALMAVYSLSETAFKEYQEKVVEQIGEVKEQKVRDAIAQDRVNANPPVEKEVIVTGTGDVLCRDSGVSGRYFRSDMQTIRKAENDINQQIFNENYASLNDFWREIGLPATKQADEMGWNLEHPLKLHFSTVLSEKGEPCLSVEYSVAPDRGFWKFS